MGKLFGTDGIRGIANETLDAELAFRIGQATAIILSETQNDSLKVLIGKDTRVSSDMLEAAITAGLTSCGADVVRLGVAPTPAVAYLTVCSGASAGIVISASHNPYEYNGIKIFNHEGFKLPDETENRIEELVLSDRKLRASTGIGIVADGSSELEYYLRHIASTVRGGLSELRVLIDCANGAAVKTAPRLFARFGIDVDFIGNKPDGKNINDGCGSTCLDNLSQRVVRGSYDMGIAFDGDADRCLAVDEKGGEINGDVIMGICARAMLEEGDLSNNTLVSTVMSNIGLHNYARDNGFVVINTSVGDKNVLEAMLSGGYMLGGEQSGHVIFLDHNTTGDGQLTALHFLSIVCKYGLPVSALAAQVPSFPQTLIGVEAPLDKSEREGMLMDPELTGAIRAAESALGGDGRVLVRASGTEALIRVMVEAKSQKTADEAANGLAMLIKNMQIPAEK